MNRKFAFLGLFSALAIILGYVESLIPLSPGIPGIKLGLANLSVLFILERYSWREALLISLIRILAVGFLFGNLFGVFYSLTGALLSLLVMSFLKRSGDISLFALSMAGGISHNIGQLLLAIAVTETMSLLFYLPVLLISGMAAGCFIGWLTREVLRRIPEF